MPSHRLTPDMYHTRCKHRLMHASVPGPDMAHTQRHGAGINNMYHSPLNDGDEAAPPLGSPPCFQNQSSRDHRHPKLSLTCAELGAAVTLCRREVMRSTPPPLHQLSATAGRRTGEPPAGRPPPPGRRASPSVRQASAPAGHVQRWTMICLQLVPPLSDRRKVGNFIYRRIGRQE